MKIVMNFFESSFSEEIYSGKRKILVNIEDSINRMIKEKDYGESIQLFIIGLICVKTQIDHLFKIRRPKYIEDSIVSYNGVQHHIEKTFECELKINYDLIINSSQEETKIQIAQVILNTLHTLKLPKKVTDFDKDRFVADVESVFRSEHLIV